MIYSVSQRTKSPYSFFIFSSYTNQFQNNFTGKLSRKFALKRTINLRRIATLLYEILAVLAVITRPPDGVVLAPSALAARRLRRLASLLEL